MEDLSVSDLLLKLSEALASNSVVDISDLIQNGSIVIISKSEIRFQRGVSIKIVPLVSDNFAAYEYVMKIFGPEYQIYIDLYGLTYGKNKINFTIKECKLYDAIQDGALRKVKRLVRKGVNIHYNNDKPLHTAINEYVEDKVEIIRYLLKHGAVFRDLKDAYELLRVITNDDKAENLDLVKYLIETILLSPNGNSLMD